MIREILEQYFDTGVIPVLEKNEDPFWDPPNPILIGQAFLQLNHLSYFMENVIEAQILSVGESSGAEPAMLSVGY